MNATLIWKQDRERILREVHERYGIEKFPYLLLKTGREKVRAFSGSITREGLKMLIECAVVEIIGFYFAKEEKSGLRLSLDAPQVLHESINKNILDIDDVSAELWLKGQDIFIPTDLTEWVVVRNRGDLLGCGRVSEGRIINFIPKERRLR